MPNLTKKQLEEQIDKLKEQIIETQVDNAVYRIQNTALSYFIDNIGLKTIREKYICSSKIDAETGLLKIQIPYEEISEALNNYKCGDYHRTFEVGVRVKK